MTTKRTRLPGPRRPVGAPATSRILTVRVPAALGAALDDQAARDGVTAGALARRFLLAGLPAVDAEAAVSVRAYAQPRPAPTADVVAVARLREAVGEAVGTLRQVAGLDRARGGARLAEIDVALDRLLAAAADLDGVKRVLLREPEAGP